MSKKLILTLIISLLLLGVPISGVLAIDGSINKSQQKNIYDESKDANLRRGTENWEQSQSSFFIVPGIFLSLAGLALFFSRKK
ncbi:MAG: hypothetical protein ACO294_06105 [Methylococcales bacterium]|jgi:hypothetical protein